jgi:arylsulfatase A-like enzyme
MQSITRRDFNRRVAAALAAGAGTYAGTQSGALAQAGPGANAARPNIVVLLSDDHRADMLGCMGNPVIRTPHLDAMAEQGALFTNNFCTSAVCCCSRASILTGTYNRANRVHDFETDLSPEMLELSYPVRLRNAGYRTGFIGKYGVGTNLPSELSTSGAVSPARGRISTAKATAGSIRTISWAGRRWNSSIAAGPGSPSAYP